MVLAALLKEQHIVGNITKSKQKEQARAGGGRTLSECVLDDWRRCCTRATALALCRAPQHLSNPSGRTWGGGKERASGLDVRSQKGSSTLLSICVCGGVPNASRAIEWWFPRSLHYCTKDLCAQLLHRGENTALRRWRSTRSTHKDQKDEEWN